MPSLQHEAKIDLPYLSEKAHVKTYENGYTFVFVPKKGDVFNVSTWVRTGSIHEDEKINGISHFLEHLLFKGTERFKPGEFDHKMESMGAIINAATWKDFTFYYVTGPKGVPSETGASENFETALDMHADMMLCSTIPDAEVGPQYDPFDADYAGEKRERSVVIEEIGMREDQPWTKVYNSVNHMMYPEGHPYQRDVIGTRKIIGEVPRETIVDYYKTWYSPQNMTTIVVGDFEPGDLEAKVLKCFDFKNRKADALPMENYPLDAARKSKQYEEVKGDYQTAFFIIGYHAPRPKVLKETIALDIVSHVLGESRNARLPQALIEKPEKPIFNYIGCDQSTYKLGNVFYIQGNYNCLEGPDFPAVPPEAAMAQVFGEVEKLLLSEPLTQDEFNRAVKKMKVDFAATSETASGIAETIGECLTVTGDLAQYVDYLPTLESLTLEEVLKVAKNYLARDKAYTSVLLPNH
ncbi:MAG: pitrilysin family protein [Vampirovibrionales bacterium]|nr:pitrilysin family protein [Vampirovibrionales bacterium]